MPTRPLHGVRKLAESAVGQLSAGDAETQAFFVKELGHQTFEPMSQTAAGTSTERTRSASNSTPNETAKPIAAKKTIYGFRGDVMGKL